MRAPYSGTVSNGDTPVLLNSPIPFKCVNVEITRKSLESINSLI